MKNLRSQVRFDTDAEKYSQWVRASYPYTDAYRSSLLAQFNNGLTGLKKSHAAEYFKVWSDRYSMVKSYQFRADKGWKAAAAPDLTWGDSERDSPLHMYVMRDTYKSGQSVPQKGQERWNKEEALAEELFTLIAFAHRKPQDALFSPVIFQNPHRDGTLAHAQTLIYNANEQQPPPAGSQPGTEQPNVGWDTLNWSPPVKAFEHGGGPSIGAAKWPWELFTKDAVLQSDRCRVQLNWQAKLVPVTATRIKPSRTDSKIPSDIRRVLKRTQKNFQDLVTH